MDTEMMSTLIWKKSIDWLKVSLSFNTSVAFFLLPYTDNNYSII